MNQGPKGEDVTCSRMVKGTSIQDMKESNEDSSDIWCLRKECQDASKALRSRRNDGGDKVTITHIEETPTEKATVENPPRVRRPGLVHRKTDPCPMREFARTNWIEREENTEENAVGNMDEKRHDLIANDTFDLNNENIFNEEQFLISSYELAKRRMSLPLSTLSTVEHTWNRGNVMYEDSDDTDNVSLETPVKNQQRSSCIKQLHHSPMEKRRRQSAWTHRPSGYGHSLDETSSKPMSKRRMSELPALSALATRRRSVPHTLSLPQGLRRRTSRTGSSSDHQNLNSSCLKAKNEMLATLSLSTWSENVRHQEISRRKSCHTGFGIMALKKKEEKRLMVAHEILQTEKNYIKALETLHEVFTEPLKNSCVIPEKDIRTMFPKQLLAMKAGHEKFMNELDDRLNNWKWQGVLGDIFAKLGNSYHVDFMTLYSEYVNNFPKSIAVINKYMRNSQKFKRFLEKCSNDSRCERLSISAFLLTPIQRLPRYVLLLRQLAKYTDPNHPDSFHIEISLEKMIDIINILNSSIQNSTRVARNSSVRRSTRRRRKRHIFKARDSGNSDLTSPRKSSDDSEWSETSTPSTPHAQNSSPLTIDITSPAADQKSSDYGSLTNSETPSEPNSPSPSSGSSSRTSSFLKVILRNSGESKRSKRRPLSTTEVEIFRRKDCSEAASKDELTRSVSRDSIGSMIRHKFVSLRRRPRSSEENLDKNSSLERLSDCRSSLFKHRRATSPDDDIFREESNECSKSDTDLVEEKKGLKPEGHNSGGLNPEGLNSGSSLESCTGSREHLSLPRDLGVHSDSDDSTSHLDSRPTSRLEGDVIDNNNHVILGSRRSCPVESTEKQLMRKKLGKRNSFTNAVKYFFVSKARSSSSSPETVLGGCACVANSQDHLYNSQLSKEKISTV